MSEALPDTSTWPWDACQIRTPPGQPGHRLPAGDGNPWHVSHTGGPREARP